MAAYLQDAFYKFAVYKGSTIHALDIPIEGTLDLRGLFMLEKVFAGFKTCGARLIWN